MLYLVRKPEESIIINNNIEIKVIEITRKHVKLGLSFPNSCSVLRKEVYDRMQKENLEALIAFDVEQDDSNDDKVK
ncbi:carbon storage regulator [endosymbiont of Acanthamoeba sp. UWC8]|uniref:carbon storage regulator n=1 Tax=endosymbiont of Acanthamoeba sp. UWC8 TaxID=86106 RepID=UPI0004D1C358|nr:carbon storage regulator [endosymbiont of Acanthamoeba sp. UWC8]AIF80773.1 carbon storage regulator [endosymbiont of Acanthamoeba sp. UWC8]